MKKFSKAAYKAAEAHMKASKLIDNYQVSSAPSSLRLISVLTVAFRFSATVIWQWISTLSDW